MTPAFLTLLAGIVTAFQPMQTRQPLDDGWDFTMTLDDKGAPVASETIMVDLPHDWSILNDFDKDASAGNEGGYLPTGAGVYRKTLSVGKGALAGRHVELNIEGAYMNPSVSVNGQNVGSHAYGYTPFLLNITPYLHEGDNTIEISVDNTKQKNCRWYTGSGIYRHVSLLNLPETHVVPRTLFVTTPVVTSGRAKVDLSFELTGDKTSTSAVIISPEGKEVARASKEYLPGVNDFSFEVSAPDLWTPDTPALYTLVLKAGDHEVRQPFGIREITYSASDGLRLNGTPITLNGSCVHHDNGLLGARSYDVAEARKVRLLKEAGFNAVRTSHNPPSEAFLDECDRQGLLVIDEIFDGWRDGKLDHDYHEQFDTDWAFDVEAMVTRDRNHPSIMAWSIGNEVIERKKLEVVTTAAKLAVKCRELDPTRPVTSALAAWDSDWEIYDPLAAQHEIVGYNYMIHKSEDDHQRVPDRVMWQTESFPRDAFSNWVKVNDYPYIIGDFVWTGIDYLGESSIGRHYYEGESEGESWHRPQFPWHASYCGDIDLIGERKPISYYRDLLHNPTANLIYMAVREPDGYYGKVKQTMWGTWPTYESWNWPGHEGKPVTVEIVSRSPQVALYLDDTLIGKAPTTRNEKFMATFDVQYRPGTLRAVALDASGNPTGEDKTIATAGKPVALRLVADRKCLVADNQDLSYITVEAVDAEGRRVPDAAPRVSFSVNGQGSLEATGTADIKDTEGYHHTDRTLWRGAGQAVVKSTRKPGAITVKASSPGLKPASITLKSGK